MSIYLPESLHIAVMRNRRSATKLRIRIAPDNEQAPTFASRLPAFPLVFVPWLILYESVLHLGPLPGAFAGYLPGEVHWPIWQWMQPVYASAYVLVPLVPLVVTTNHLLRRFVLAGMVATVIGHLMFLAIPVIAPPRPFEPHGVLGMWMLQERRMDLNNGTGAFPSFHVIWAFLGASALAVEFPRLRQLLFLWAGAVSVSCVFTGMHAAVDILAGFVIYLLAWSHPQIVKLLKRLASASTKQQGFTPFRFFGTVDSGPRTAMARAADLRSFRGTDVIGTRAAMTQVGEPHEQS